MECPVGDFFACGWGEFAQVSSLAVCVNPGSALQLLLGDAVPAALPDHAEQHRRRAEMVLYYQINYTLTDVPDDVGYFHAQFRRTQPAALQRGVHDPRRRHGRGPYVGTYLAWGVNNNGWWGEGEIKFFLDGDGEFPTICGTGTEDYFCGSYNFENKETEQYQEFTTPYAGLPQVIRPDGLYQSQTALRHVPLARHGSDPLRDRICGDDPGARLAHAAGATCRCRTTSRRSRTGTRRRRLGSFRCCPARTSSRSSEPQLVTPFRTRRRYAMGVTPA